MRGDVISDNICKKLEKDYLPCTIKRWDKLLKELVGDARNGSCGGFYSDFYKLFCKTQLVSEIVERKDVNERYLYYEALYRVMNELEGFIEVTKSEYKSEGFHSTIEPLLREGVVEDYKSRYNVTKYL